MNLNDFISMTILLHFVLLGFGNLAYSQQKLENADVLCAKRTQEILALKYVFVACEKVDWGVQPLSSSYQPDRLGAMTLKADQIQGYKRTYLHTEDPNAGSTTLNAGVDPNFYGIKNGKYSLSREFVDDGASTGAPHQGLAWKYMKAFRDENGQASETFQYLEKSWYPDLNKDKSGAAYWNGKCDAWSMSSMDPEINRIFNGVKDGLMCSGTPFTRGELKELLTSLYPEPYASNLVPTPQEAHLSTDGPPQMIARNLRVNAQNGSIEEQKYKFQIEDTNLALSQLGMLGNGNFNLGQVIHAAQAAKAKGENLMMDREPGGGDGPVSHKSGLEEVWNQPIKQMVDFSYFKQLQFSDEETAQVASSADFDPSHDESGVLRDLRSIEYSFVGSLAYMRSDNADRLKALCVKLGKPCPELNSATTLATQVAMFNDLKALAVHEHFVKFKVPLKAVTHELIIDYGDENPFASKNADQLIRKVYPYVSFHEFDTSTKTLGPAIRSQAMPKMEKMSDVCKNSGELSSRATSKMTADTIYLLSFCNGNSLVPGVVDFEVAVTPFPPKKIMHYQTFSESLKEKQLSCDSPSAQNYMSEKERSYCSFLAFLKKCDSFDDAMQFLRRIDQAVSNGSEGANRFSAADIEDIKRLYTPKVKSLIDAQFVQDKIKPYQNVPGFSALQAALQ